IIFTVDYYLCLFYGSIIIKQEFNQSNERILLKEEKDVDNMIKLITSGATYNPLKIVKKSIISGFLSQIRKQIQAESSIF
ncbi:hypothetical protein DERP_009663, partial [Dermatophagoides pteronyssinus]